MSLALFESERHERLAGPTSAIPSRPEPLRTLQWSDELAHDEVDEVTAIVDQAACLAKRHPRSPGALSRLAHAQLAASRAGEARRSARRAVELLAEDMDIPALVAAAQVLSAVGDSASAEAALAGAGGQAFPDLHARFAIDRRDWETALARLGDWEGSAVGGLRGWVLLQLGRHADAVHSLRHALASSPASPDLYINIGYAHAVLGTLPKAIKATRTATALSPSNRTAAFNLAALYALSGNQEAALASLAKLRSVRPLELSVRLAIAGVYSSMGDHALAERTLESARADQSGWAASPHDRAALRANLAALKRAQGKLTLKEARARIQSSLVDTEYSDLGIARLLAGLYAKSSEARRFGKIVGELSRRHDSIELAAFRCQLAFLELRFEEATREAWLWVAQSPFDGPAATTLTYLLGEFEGDYAAAVREGLKALQRIPSDARLRNNVVYSLIRCDQLGEARRLLHDSKSLDLDDTLLATAGLLALKEGDLDRGMALYERAASGADARGDADLVNLIHYCLAVECTRLGIKSPYDMTVLRERLRDDPRLHVHQAVLGDDI